MAKNLVSDLMLGLFAQIWALNFFGEFYLYWIIDIVASYHCMQFQGKLMNQTCENGKKPSFETNFCPFGPILDPKTFFMNFTSITC